MYSTGYIVQLNTRAAARAAAEQRVPYQPWDAAEVDTWSEFPFPNLGYYVPDGWQLIDSYLCDATGWGRPDEPAFTQQQLCTQIKADLQGYHNPGYAIIEVGEFQVVVGVFVKDHVWDFESDKDE